VVMVTASLENLGGILPDGSEQDVGAIQVVYTYDPLLLQVMREYKFDPSSKVLPDLNHYTSTVRNYCAATGGVSLDTIVPDEFHGLIQSSALCDNGGASEVGVGCDPSYMDPFRTGTCPGDPSTGGTTPLQNLDVMRAQFLILGRGNLTFHQMTDQYAQSGSEIIDEDTRNGTRMRTILPMTLVDATFDNRSPLTFKSFMVSPDLVFVDQDRTFTAVYSGGARPFNCSFSFGSFENELPTNLTSNGPSCATTHAYLQAGTFNATVRVTDLSPSDHVTGILTVVVQPQPHLVGMLSWKHHLSSQDLQIFRAPVSNPSSIAILARFKLLVIWPNHLAADLVISSSFALNPGQTRGGLSFDYAPFFLPASGIGQYCFTGSLEYGVNLDGNRNLMDSEILGVNSVTSGCFDLV